MGRTGVRYSSEVGAHEERGTTSTLGIMTSRIEHVLSGLRMLHDHEEECDVNAASAVYRPQQIEFVPYGRSIGEAGRIRVVRQNFGRLVLRKGDIVALYRQHKRAGQSRVGGTCSRMPVYRMKRIAVARRVIASRDW